MDYAYAHQRDPAAERDRERYGYRERERERERYVVSGRPSFEDGRRNRPPAPSVYNRRNPSPSSSSRYSPPLQQVPFDGRRSLKERERYDYRDRENQSSSYSSAPPQRLLGSPSRVTKMDARWTASAFERRTQSNGHVRPRSLSIGPSSAPRIAVARSSKYEGRPLQSMQRHENLSRRALERDHDDDVEGRRHHREYGIDRLPYNTSPATGSTSSIAAARNWDNSWDDRHTSRTHAPRSSYYSYTPSPPPLLSTFHTLANNIHADPSRDDYAYERRNYNQQHSEKGLQRDQYASPMSDRSPRLERPVNGSREDKGKGPSVNASEDELRCRGSSLASRMSKDSIRNNGQLQGREGERHRNRSPGRIPTSARSSRSRRSPSYPLTDEQHSLYKSTTSLADSSSRASDRYIPDYFEREREKDSTHPRTSAPPSGRQSPSTEPTSFSSWQRRSLSPRPLHNASDGSPLKQTSSPEFQSTRSTLQERLDQPFSQRKRERRGSTPSALAHRVLSTTSLTPSNPKDLHPLTLLERINPPPTVLSSRIRPPANPPPSSSHDSDLSPFHHLKQDGDRQSCSSASTSNSTSEKEDLLSYETSAIKPIKALSPLLQENDRSFPNGHTSHLYQSSSKPALAVNGGGDGMSEQLPRAPVPMRPAADPIFLESTSSLPTDSANIDRRRSYGYDIDTPIQSTTDTRVLMDVNPIDSFIRPSSPLSELPNTQPLDLGGDEPDFEQGSTSESEQDGRSNTVFAKLLNSFIQGEGSKDQDFAHDEAMAIFADNHSKAPMTLPLIIERVPDDTDLFKASQSMLANQQVLEPFLMQDFAECDKIRGHKIYRLRQAYKELDQEWQTHCSKLEKIRSRQKRRQTAQPPPLTPSVDSSVLNTPATPSILAPSSRANRRNAASTLGYGDAARSEAEFLEILASLEDADMRDPNLRAMRTTATVPDMLIDSSEIGATQAFDDKNGLVIDPFEYYGVNKLPDVWTEDEIATFCRRYALYPKQFGKIAIALPNKTIAQSVLFYYRSKRKIDLKALVDKRSRDGKRKKMKMIGEKGQDEGAIPDKKKGTSLLANLKRSKADDLEEDDADDDDEPQTPGSAIAADAFGVMPTAKALIDHVKGQQDNQNLGKLGIGGEIADLMEDSDSSRYLTARSGNKKATRFLSPPQLESVAVDSVMLPSDGAIAAAEALGALASLSTDLSETSYFQQPMKQNKRKPSISEQSKDAPYGEDLALRSGIPNKRAKQHSSSYWSVAEKNEFLRLLAVHGKNYSAIADGIDSKTTVQCKNFYQNNTKKLGLAQIAQFAEDELQQRGQDESTKVDTSGQLPSVFINPNGLGAQPPAGYFLPHLSFDNEHEEIASNRGGMHLRNLLDDAPDAEGGARDQFRDNGRPSNNETVPDDDSSTEDEAEPARHASWMSQRLKSDMMRDKYSEAILRRPSPSIPIDPELQELPSFNVRSHSDSRHSPVYDVRESTRPPAYPSVLADSIYSTQYSTHQARMSRQYSEVPLLPRIWSPYDRPAYNPPEQTSQEYRNNRVNSYEEAQSPHYDSSYYPTRQDARIGKPLPSYDHSPLYDARSQKGPLTRPPIGTPGAGRSYGHYDGYPLSRSM